MKVLATAAVLCTALFVTLDAAPALKPSWLPLDHFEKTEKQGSDRSELPKTLQNVFSRIVASRSDGSIQADSEIGRALFDTFTKIFSAASKATDPNDEVGHIFLNGASTILSLLGKQFTEGVEIQSDDEIQKAFMKFFGSVLSAAMKKIDKAHGAEAQSVEEIAPIFLNVGKSFLSGLRKNVNPDDELSQTLLDGFGNLLSAMGRKFMESNGQGAETQSSAEMMRASNFVDLLSTLRGVGIENNKAQSPSTDDENVFNTLLSVVTKETENGETQHMDEIMPAFTNIVSKLLSKASKSIDPSDDVGKTVLNILGKIVYTFGQKFGTGSDGGIQAQSSNDLSRSVLDLIGTVGSALQKKTNPSDKTVQGFFSLFNSLLSKAKTRVGGAQEVYTETTLPTHTTTDSFDQTTTASVDKNLATAAAGTVDLDLSREAKTQLWGAILGGLASGVLNRFLDG